MSLKSRHVRCPPACELNVSEDVTVLRISCAKSTGVVLQMMLASMVARAYLQGAVEESLADAQCKEGMRDRGCTSDMRSVTDQRHRSRQRLLLEQENKE